MHIWCICCLLLLCGVSLLIYYQSMKNDLAVAFGKNLMRLRKLKDWTQRELAELVNIDHSMVARWENGKVLPRSATIQRLAEALEVPVDDLLTAFSDNTARYANGIDDPQLAELLSNVSVLETRDKEALKAVLEAMFVRYSLKEMSAQPLQRLTKKAV